MGEYASLQLGNFLFLLPVAFFLIIWVIVFVFIIRNFRRPKNKKTTMQDFAKNPLGNAFNVAFGSIAQASALDSAFQNVLANPCQQTADALLNELNNVDEVFKFSVSSSRNVNTALWKNAFNECILPCKNIRIETKQKIRAALISLSVDRLKVVVDTDAVGAAAEDNVWDTLKYAANYILSNGKCNAFYSVRIPYHSNINPNEHSQEIDNIVVCSKGVFLIEVKNQGSAIQDHSVQIGKHAEAFKQTYPTITPKENLLVISCPKGEYVTVDRATIPNSSTYKWLTVDAVYNYFVSYEGPDILDDAAIDAISQDLKKRINYKDDVVVTKWFIDGVEGTPLTSNKKFCSNCGNQVNSNVNFCPNCGNKL